VTSGTKIEQSHHGTYEAKESAFENYVQNIKKTKEGRKVENL
jgi:hypothetical protein